MRATGGLRKQWEIGVKSKSESSPPLPHTRHSPIGGLAGRLNSPIGGLKFQQVFLEREGGDEAHSGPSTSIGIKYKRTAVGIQVKLINSPPLTCPSPGKQAEDNYEALLLHVHLTADCLYART